jgi:hypothetical protein
VQSAMTSTSSTSTDNGPSALKQFAYPPLRNGLDFLASAVDLLQGEPTEQQLKYAVLHAAAGAEILLKARLDLEDWRLVLQHTDKANELAYRSGSFLSVRMSDLPERLAEHCGLDLDRELIQALDIVIAARNRLQHFGHTDSAQATLAAIGRLISFLFDFVHDELIPWISDDEVTEELARIHDGLTGIDAVVDARWETISDRINDHDSAALACPVCLQPAWLGEPTNRCLFCGYTGDGEAAALEWAVRVLI